MHPNPLDTRLLAQASIRYLAGVILVGLLLFLPAGSLMYRQAWLLLGILFIPMLIAGTVLFMRNPDLLRRRLDAREDQGDQRLIVLLSSVMFVSAFVVAGLTYRFRWPMLPFWSSVPFAVVFLFGYALYAAVLKQNEYLSRTIEVSEGQRVVDTGLYGLVRHPMYLSTLVLFLSAPLVLGSAFSFLIMLAYIPIIICRIKGEERVLEQELEGYRAYERRVRYRLIPHVW